MNSVTCKRSVLSILVCALVCVPNTNTAAGQNVIDSNGTQLRILIPSGMRNIRFVLDRIETVNEVSLLRYGISVTGTESVYGLQWRIVSIDEGNRVLRSEAWWDRNEWLPGSHHESQTVFDYDGSKTIKLTVFLCEMETSSGVRRLVTNALDEDIRRLTANPLEKSLSNATEL